MEATSIDFYRDQRYCPQCRRYVRYLQSPNAAYCVECGQTVKLFSAEDFADFRRGGSMRSDIDESSIDEAQEA